MPDKNNDPLNWLFAGIRPDWVYDELDRQVDPRLGMIGKWS
jgi:hypothetical protein